VILAIYRPPDKSLPDFNYELLQILSDLNNSRSPIIIVGDLNIDLINPNAAEVDVICNLNSSSFSPLITYPTHISNNCAKCIDHIWFNHPNNVVHSGVLDIVITDHLPVFAVMNYKGKGGESKLHKFRDHSYPCLLKLGERLSVFTEEFGTSGVDDINVKCEEFCDSIYQIYDSCCPVRMKFLSNDRIMKPWITNSLIDCIDRKHNLFRRYKRGLVNFDVYNSYKNIVTSLLRKVKTNYYYKRFSCGNRNSRDIWRGINRLSGNAVSKGAVDVVVVDGVSVSDPLMIADHFNRYFSDVGLNLDAAMPHSLSSPTEWMNATNPHSFFIRPSTSSNVCEVIKSLPNKSSNLVSVPMFIYKYYVDLFSPAISLLFNRSISDGIFPDCLKIARVIPVHKAGDKKSINNYRPISILPILSKIFEKLMFLRLNDFISEYNLISSHQFGFRKSASTSDAISEFLDSVYDSLSARKFLVSIFLDFSKAFDTVNHSVLLRKLSHLGIRGVASAWFKSFLCNRLQYVCISSHKSRLSDVRIGVPQGSILGPVLFLLYIDDMCNSSRMLKYVHFADDTTAFHSGSNLKMVVDEVNADLRDLKDWLCCNRLSLNIAKTSFMLFTDNRVEAVPVIQISDISVNQVSQARFLGVIVDEKLNFREHTANLAKQVSRSVGLLNRVSGLLPVCIKSNIYYALIFSRISYGIIAWGYGAVSGTVTLDRILCKAHRIINYAPPSTNQACKSFLDFYSIRKYFLACKFFRIIREDNHDYFVNVIGNLIPHHDHGTRFNDGNNYSIPFYSKSKCQRSFLFQAVKVWNSLPSNLKLSVNVKLFKNNLKIHLLAIQ